MLSSSNDQGREYAGKVTPLAFGLTLKLAFALSNRKAHDDFDDIAAADEARLEKLGIASKRIRVWTKADTEPRVKCK